MAAKTANAHCKNIKGGSRGQNNHQILMTFIAAGAKYLDREVAATEVCADALYDLAIEVPPSSNSISSPFFLKLVTNFPCMSHIVFGNAAFQKI